MKKFRWRLQRLLEVRRKQEDALRAELMAMTEQSAALRGRILMEKAMLRSRLAEVRQTAASRRVVCQQDFMACVSVIDARIAHLQRTLNELEAKRKEKTEAMMTVRKSCKALERLRAKALEDYADALNRESQMILDESAAAAFARKASENVRSRIETEV